MINEKKLKKELQKRFDAFVRKCGMADDMKSDGYASCYDDVSDIIEQLAAKNDIESGRERTTLTDSRIKLVLSDRLFKMVVVSGGRY